MGAATTSSDDQYDVFKDSLVRYCGYANEVGEAFRALVHVRWVWLSYGVASSYVLADSLDKGWKEHQRNKQPSSTEPPSAAIVSVPPSSSSSSSSPAVAFADTLIWQGLASVIIPGFTINRICYLTGHALKFAATLPTPARKWATTAVGLGCIPFIVGPIDRSVDIVMDRSLRRWYRFHPKIGACVEKKE